jgi:hypothetical protein
MEQRREFVRKILGGNFSVKLGDGDLIIVHKTGQCPRYCTKWADGINDCDCRAFL